jgi:DNA-directed RNA polymerase subunit RPC12/RpoP
MGFNRELKNTRERAYYGKNPDRVRDRSYKRLYGISLVEYNTILVKQDYRCAMCKRHVSELRFHLAVDHNHQTGAVRGLLCTSCNAGLGIYEDKVFVDMCNNYLGAF